MVNVAAGARFVGARARDIYLLEPSFRDVSANFEVHTKHQGSN